MMTFEDKSPEDTSPEDQSPDNPSPADPFPENEFLARRSQGRRSDRNRKRPKKRRRIFCPIHGCYLDSVSPKYPLFASQPSHLRERGMGRKPAYLVVATYGAVPLRGEWIECFWCKACEHARWYHVRRQDKAYTISVAPIELWKQATGVLNPEGNPTVSEFTRKAARLGIIYGVKTYRFM